MPKKIALQRPYTLCSLVIASPSGRFVDFPQAQQRLQANSTILSSCALRYEIGGMIMS